MDTHGQPSVAYGATSVVETTTIHLSAHLRRRLTAVSRQRGVPQAQIIRQALEGFLERHDEACLPSWIGAATDGPPTDSSALKLEAREAWYREFVARMGWDA
jgi:predicted transcriptional regulator